MRVLTALVILILTLASLTAQGPRPVLANPGETVDSSRNLWAPYGPLSKSLQFNYYSTETTEFTDFELGHLDLTDWPLPLPKFPSYDANPDFVLSPGQGQYGMFGVDFNYGSSTWASWGCNWQHGNGACGIEIREAIAHLIDRQSFVNSGPLQGAGQALADPSPPAKDPSSSPLATQVSWDTLSGQNVSGIVHLADTSAFHIDTSMAGFAAPGSPDFCAARDHLIAANIGLQDSNFDCAIDPSSPGLSNILSHPMRFMIRSDDPTRKAMGQGLMAAINQLFGGNVVSPTFGSIAQLGTIVFVSAPEGPSDDWDMYTSGWNLPGPFPDHLRPLYGSTFASDQCGGDQNGETVNYGFMCISSFDAHADTASQTASLTTFKTETLAAFNELGKHAASIPVYARGIRVAALRSMGGLVNQRGQSYPNPWTLMNAHNDTSYTPVNSMYKFGGGSNTVRWGQKQGTTQLNPFNAETVWEFNVIGEVYDTLFVSSPIEPANVMCWMCNSYSIVSDAQGNTHFQVNLKPNLRWHDGVPVNASDVKFTLLNVRDVPAAVLQGNVGQLLGVTILGPYQLDIKMQGQSISHIVNLSGVPILPRHIWQIPGDKTYGDVGKADPVKTGNSYDMLSAGTLIGSGPFMCVSVFGSDYSGGVVDPAHPVIGKGCARNADGSRGGQALGPGASLLLQAFDMTSLPGTSDPFLQYMRSFNSAWSTGSGVAAFSGQFQEFSWADRYDNATVTIRDLASVASCFGKTSSAGCADYAYWLRPSFHTGTPGTVGAEVTIVASHFDDTWVSPFSWSGNQSSQPGLTLENITPFVP